jgi:Mrp family chromosome partitioning ATPase
MMTRKESLPRLGHLDRSMEKPAMREAFARLLANLGGSAAGVFGLAAARPGEGVTTLALYLGAEIVRTFSVRALVVEANFRRPRLAHYADVAGTPGLRDVLESDGLKLDVKVRRSSLEDLFLLPAGGIHPHPLGLLTSERFGRFLTAARERYPAVIVDAPPVLTCAESPVVLAVVDRSALVVADGAREDAVRQAVRVLQDRGLQMAGTVLNRWR